MLNLSRPKTRSSHRAKFLGSLIGILVSFTLIGCARIESDVTIYKDEQWAGTIKVELPAETVSFIGGIDEVEYRLEEAKEEYEQKGLQVALDREQRDDGTVVIMSESEGQGLDQLNEMFFEGEADISVETVKGQRQIKIRESFPSNEIGTNIIKITGGEIVSSNADRVEGNTAIWRNPNRFEVTLTEASNSSWFWWALGSLAMAGLCVGVLVLAAGGGILFWYRRKQQA